MIYLREKVTLTSSMEGMELTLLMADGAMTLCMAKTEMIASKVEMETIPFWVAKGTTRSRPTPETTP